MPRPLVWVSGADKNLEGVRRAGYVSISIGAGFMALMTIVLLLFPQQVIRLYIDIRNPENATILALGIPMLTAAAVAQIFDGMQKTAYGALQGLQDTRIPMLLSFLTYWCIGLTSGCLLGFHLGLGGTGLWLGLSIGVAITSGVFTWRFRNLTSKGSVAKTGNGL